jgi:hypothetical protein
MMVSYPFFFFDSLLPSLSLSACCFQQMQRSLIFTKSNSKENEHPKTKNDPKAVSFPFESFSSVLPSLSVSAFCFYQMQRSLIFTKSNRKENERSKTKNDPKAVSSPCVSLLFSSYILILFVFNFYRMYRSLMFLKSGLVIKPLNQRPSMSTTNSFGNLQTVEKAQTGDFAATRSEISIDPFNDPQNPAQVVQTIGDFAATRSEIPIDPFNDPQNPAQVVQTIGDFAVTNPRYVWARVKVVDGTVSFDSVSKFDLRTTCLIRYEVGGELVERRLRPYEVLEMPAER